MSGNNEIKDLDAYSVAWTDMMTKIWIEKLSNLNAVNTGTLVRSIRGEFLKRGDGSFVFLHRFMQYGFYVESGVGMFYKKDNGGDLKFLDQSYRNEMRLNEPRKKGPAWGGGYTSGKARRARVWFNKKYFSSVMNLKDSFAKIYGDSFTGIVSSIFTENAYTLNI